MHRPVRWTVLLLLFTTALTSCSGDAATAPAPARILGLEGTYRATEFITTTNRGPIDRIAEGLSMTLTLSEDSALVGLVLTPTGSAVVAGTWDTTDAMVHFHSETATFLHQIPFQIQPDGLQGEALLGVTTYRIRMKKD